ncbi:MAG: 50S ribosomal protein L35 [bacterium]|nr:50S ribosomal protein L35 [bacterium]
MPKLKSKRAAVKRFKITGTGKVLRRKANRSHILTKKAKSRKRNLGTSGLVSKGEERSIKRLLLYGK